MVTVRFWWLVRRTEWAHWDVRVQRDDGRLETVNVGLRIKVKRAVKGLGLLLALALLFIFVSRYSSLTASHL